MALFNLKKEINGLSSDITTTRSDLATTRSDLEVITNKFYVDSNNDVHVYNTNNIETIDLFSRLKSLEIYDENGNLIN